MPLQRPREAQLVAVGIADVEIALAPRRVARREVGRQPGSPGALQMVNVSLTGRIKVGDLIVTAGERATQHASLFPANLLIGQVTSVPPAANPSGAITVSPAADLTSLDSVQVLTKVPGQ